MQINLFMIRPVLIAAMCLVFFLSASAQSDTATYYLRKSGDIVGSKDSADFYMLIYPSHIASDNGLSIVKEFYLNGKIKSSGFSYTKHIYTSKVYIKLEGLYAAWFTNGNKMFVKHYTDGTQDGDETAYYPNGNFYYSETLSAGKTRYNECRDSTGKVLAANGNGKWITFTDGDFGNSKIEGQIANSRQDGEWRGKIHDTLEFVSMFKNGEKKWEYHIDTDGQIAYWMVETLPTFPGGPSGFGQFLGQNIVYPILARQNNTQGRVIITFVLDADGKPTDIKVVRGIGSGCDEEAVRVLKLSPLWTPGLVDNKPVRVQYSVPISFSLGK
jgi:TonB family protein